MILLISYVVIIVLVLFFVYKTVLRRAKKEYVEEYVDLKKNNNSIPKNIWVYWENKIGSQKPVYIQMCHDSIMKNCGEDFNIAFLDEKSVHTYLPDLRDLDHLSLPQKADYIRISLLQKYGGVWLDSDIIVFRSLLPLTNLLKAHDYVGFGCNGMNCKFKENGYPRPSNWTMMSRKDGILINRCLNSANKILDGNLDMSQVYNYHKLGRELLWKEIQYLKENTNWDYYHHTSRGIERDCNNDKFTNQRLVSTADKLNPLVPGSYMAVIYNTAPGLPQWFLDMSREEVMTGNILLSKFFRIALSDKKNLR